MISKPHQRTNIPPLASYSIHITDSSFLLLSSDLCYLAILLSCGRPLLVLACWTNTQTGHTSGEWTSNRVALHQYNPTYWGVHIGAYTTCIVYSACCCLVAGNRLLLCSDVRDFEILFSCNLLGTYVLGQINSIFQNVNPQSWYDCWKANSGQPFRAQQARNMPVLQRLGNCIAICVMLKHVQLLALRIVTQIDASSQ